MRIVTAAVACIPIMACSSFVSRHEIQGDSGGQILRAEASQVRVRNAQSRVYEAIDRQRMLRAIVGTFQDLGFQIEVLDADLGIISGKKFLGDERPGIGGLPAYLLYDEEGLVVFNRVYRNWGPFLRRCDLVRLTVTLRERNAVQMVVRASAQYYLRPVESPAAYQKLFAAFEKALLLERIGPS